MLAWVFGREYADDRVYDLLRLSSLTRKGRNGSGSQGWRCSPA
jgi:hypothetical protein